MLGTGLEIWKSLSRSHRWMLALIAVFVGLAQIDQPFPAVAPLHHIPTVLLILAAPFLLKRWPLSRLALACLVLFFLLHTLGGRYTYTNTPYDLWLNAIFGTDLKEIFGWTRNQYDRLVHFSFGLLCVYPVREILLRYANVSHALAVYVALEFVMGISAVYEILEWLLSLILAGDAVESYNGQQGDVWDAQKDMALAFLGALIAASCLVFRKYLQKDQKLRK